MSDTLAGLLGWVLIIGLFVWWRADRSKRRAAPRAGSAPSAAEAAPVARVPAGLGDVGDKGQTAGAAPGRHFSVGEFVAIPFVLAFLLFVIRAHLHDVWGIVWQVLYLGIVVTLGGAALWELVRGTRVPQPDALPRALVAGVVVLYGLLPLAGWGLVVFLGQPAGVLVPLVPAVILGAYFGAAAYRGRPARR